MHEIITTWDSIKDGVNAFVDCSKKMDGKIAVHIERYNPTKAKTLKQLNTFYSLATEFFTSGCSSFESLENLKDYYKNQIGLIRYYIYFNGEKQVKTQDRLDIPKEYKRHAIKVLGSLANAKRKQLTDAIKILIAEMINSGVNTKGFERIMKGLEGEYNYE